MNINKQKGFTLIELLIVIAIIGVLSTVVVVSLGGQGATAKDVALQSNLRQIATAVTKEEATAVRNGETFSMETVCDNAAVTNIMQTIFNTIDNQFESAGIYDEGKSASNTNAYFIAYDLNANDDADANDPTIVTNSGTFSLNRTGVNASELRAGCVSDEDSWAVWGKLTGNEYHCLDSQGSTGKSTVTSTNVPQILTDLDEATCSGILRP